MDFDEVCSDYCPKIFDNNVSSKKVSQASLVLSSRLITKSMLNQEREHNSKKLYLKYIHINIS